MRKVSIGDIFELQTRKGLAYFQCMRKVPQWGTMIRVLSGFFMSRPSDMKSITARTEQFITFFPVDYAARKGIIHHVGTAPLPAHAQEFPVFRVPGLHGRDGKVMGWSTWDGKLTHDIKDLSTELQKLPILEVLNDTALIELIEAEWTPETDFQ